MKFLIIFIVASLLFLPIPGTTEIRNVPLLVVFHIFIFTRITIKIVKRVSLTSKTRATLMQNGFEIEKTGVSHFIAKKDGALFHVKLLMRKKAHLTYHFQDENTLEFYKVKKSLLDILKGKKADPEKPVELKRTGLTKKLKWVENAKPLIVMDKFPAHVTAGENKTEIQSGDVICDKITICDYNAFCEWTKA